jgi:Fur family transcriptional regulator, iron response regulator
VSAVDRRPALNEKQCPTDAGAQKSPPLGLTELLFGLSLNLVQDDVMTLLRERGIQPSAQRIAVGAYVLFTDEHPSADQVWSKVGETFPMLSRATVYNTLHLFVEKGLLRQHVLAEGRVVFDANVERHHHFIDEESGKIYDVPWETFDVKQSGALKGFDVREYQVVLRGRRSGAARRR